jgi:hypothetical protein
VIPSARRGAGARRCRRNRRRRSRRSCSARASPIWSTRSTRWCACLAGLIGWPRFAEAFGPLYRDGVGRPGLPTRLMVGLHLLKHMDGLSDDAVCARYLDGPYAQLFCGETHFQHALPLDRSSMTRWRGRIGPERLELLLAEALATARRAGAVEEKHFERVTIATTVQPKAVTHPTDGKLLRRSIEILVRLARRHAVPLRQSSTRLSRHARRDAARRGAAEPPRPPPRGRARAPADAHLARPAGPRHRSEDRGKPRRAGRLRRAAGARSAPAPPAARRSRPGEALFPARARGGVHRQGQGSGPLRVRREGLDRHHQRRPPRPAGSSSSAPARCPAIPTTGTPSPRRSPRPSGSSPASRSRVPMPTAATAATMPARPVLSSPARSAASPRPSAASCAGATRSSPSSATPRRTAISAGTSCAAPWAMPPTPSSPPRATTSGCCAPGSPGSSRCCSRCSWPRASPPRHTRGNPQPPDIRVLHGRLGSASGQIRSNALNAHQREV